MTWPGHEFLDDIRDPGIWDRNFRLGGNLGAEWGFYYSKWQTE